MPGIETVRVTSVTGYPMDSLITSATGAGGGHVLGALNAESWSPSEIKRAGNRGASSSRQTKFEELGANAII